jgi:hypothetical protein
MKGVSVIIASIIVIIISLTAIFLALQLGTPGTDRAKEILLMQEGKNTLISIDNAVKSVSEEGQGSTRVLKISVTDGYYLIDTEKEAVIFSMDSFSQIIAVGVSKTENGINMIGEPSKVSLNLSYDNFNVTGGGGFGRGTHTLIIKNDGYENQKQEVYISLSVPLPPGLYTDQYNQSETFVFEGNLIGGVTDNLNDLGINTYDIEDILIGGESSYYQFSTNNITGFNTTSAIYTELLDGANYNVTSKTQEVITTNSYNQFGVPYIAFGGAASGDYNDLNALGEGLTYNIPEASQGGGSDTYQRRPDNYQDIASGCSNWGNAYNFDGLLALCDVTVTTEARWWNNTLVPDLGTINSAKVGVKLSSIGSRAGKNPDDYQIDYGYATTFGDCGTVGTWNTITSNQFPGSTLTFYNLSISNPTLDQVNNICWRFYGSKVGGDDGYLINIDAFFIEVTYSAGITYRTEVWHNSSSISYSGTLNSVNATINFTTTQTDIYSLQIYDWQNSQWNSINCDSSSVAANTPTQFWCNKTTNPSYYNSSNGIIRIRISSTADGDQGTLIEDYVQYYISSTELSYANISVEHNSSTISENPASINQINITSRLKTNTSGISFTLYAYNFTYNGWYQCQQVSIGTSYSNIECILNDPVNFIDNGIIRVRLNSSGDTTIHEMMEDYLVYQITSPSSYRMGVEHNATGVVVIPEDLENVNISVNFSVNISSIQFSLIIYDFTNGNWYTGSSCDSGSPNNNEWNMWWCNMTSSPGDYFDNGKIKIRLNNTAHSNPAKIQEDYVQYYVTYTS